MTTKIAPKLSTVEAKLDEVEEHARNIIELRRRLKRLKRGGPGYHDLLPELSVELEILSPKLKHALQFLDEYEESLSDEE
ncbi:MAG: hypothetical protein ACRD3T_12205 [Terriglobia bacterium]